MARRKNLQTLQEDLDVLSAEVSDLPAAPPVRNRHGHWKNSGSASVASGRISGKWRLKSPAINRPPSSPWRTKVDPVEDTLGERPIATIAAGLGLGFILGMMWRRG